MEQPCQVGRELHRPWRRDCRVIRRKQMDPAVLHGRNPTRLPPLIHALDPQIVGYLCAEKGLDDDLGASSEDGFDAHQRVGRVQVPEDVLPSDEADQIVEIGALGDGVDVGVLIGPAIISVMDNLLS